MTAATARSATAATIVAAAIAGEQPERTPGATAVEPVSAADRGDATPGPVGGAPRKPHWPFAIAPIRVFAPVVVFILVMTAWTVVSHFVIAEDSRFLLPPPESVLSKGLLNAATRTEILGALGSTVQIALTGLIIAIALGVAFAVIMSQAKWAEYSLYPYAVVLQTIPVLAVVPLFGFWFGYEFGSRVIVCVMVSLFPVITNTLFGLKSVNAAEHDLFTLHGASAGSAC